MKIKIKYFGEVKKLNKITKGNWIDVYASEDVFVPVGESAMVPLGFALELPKGYEGHLAPRSSTFKTWGLIQTNSLGIIDDTFIGDNNMWCMPVYCLKGKDKETSIEEVLKDKDIILVNTVEKQNVLLLNCALKRNNRFIEAHETIRKGTWVRKGDKIGQFRIMEVMPKLEFEEVNSFGNEDRGSFGSTGRR